MMITIPFMILAIENDDDRTLVIDIYLKYRKLMYSVAMQIVQDHQIAEDMVMAAIADMIDKIEVLRKIQRCRMRSYVASIVRNDSIDYVRKRNRQGKYAFLPDDEELMNKVASEGEVDDAVLQDAEIEVLHKALAGLSMKERLLLTMKYVDESSDKDIAAVLHIGQDSVRTYLSRARKHLQQIIKEVEEYG